MKQKKPKLRRVVLDARDLKPKQVPISIGRVSLTRKLGLHFPKHLRDLALRAK